MPPFPPNHCEQDAVNTHSYSAGVIDWSGKTGKRPAGFHLWGCEFTPDTMRFNLECKLTHETDATTFSHGPLNIWLTCLAVLWGDPVKTKAMDDTKLPAWAEFDWVRFYQK